MIWARGPYSEARNLSEYKNLSESPPQKINKYIYIYIYMHVYMYMYVCVDIYNHTHIYIYIYIHIHICVYTSFLYYIHI